VPTVVVVVASNSTSLYIAFTMVTRASGKAAVEKPVKKGESFVTMIRHQMSNLACASSSAKSSGGKKKLTAFNKFMVCLTFLLLYITA
jgi:hypothetical protein